MERALLLQVQDRFQIATIGLVLLPDFPVPAQWGWQPRTATVLIRRPDGIERERDASIQVTHFTRSQPDPDRDWCIAVVLPSATKDDVPVGSEIWCASELCALLVPPTVS